MAEESAVADQAPSSSSSFDGTKEHAKSTLRKKQKQSYNVSYLSSACQTSDKPDLCSERSGGRLQHVMVIAPAPGSVVAQMAVNSGSNVQYRLTARRKGTNSFLQRIKKADQEGTSNPLVSNNRLFFLFNVNQIVTSYLHWTFRTSFVMLFASCIVLFFFLTVVFALLILWSGSVEPRCIHPSFVGETVSEKFADSFALSWTTFSVVGYGVIFPGTSADFKDPEKFNASRQCTAISFLCSFESFCGVLFAGFCGAVLYGKVARIQSHAQVIFSDPIVVRYGTGLLSACHSNDGSGSEDGDVDEYANSSFREKHPRIPCPVLEFRLINRLHASIGGEIMDATLNCVASVKQSEENPASINVINPMDKKGKGFRNRLRKSLGSYEMQYHDAVQSTSDVKNDFNEPAQEGLDLESQHISENVFVAQQAMVEDASNIAPRRIFSKLDLQANEHPFLKRNWLARHVVDAKSPLLSPRARKLVNKNGGFWPMELNNYQDVRENIIFDQILVSLTGTSNVNAASVYAQKIYDFIDMNVGYHFANVLYRDRSTGSICVDVGIINDVTAQNGGGNEPFHHNTTTLHKSARL